jgi:hypothetical protein
VSEYTLLADTRRDGDSSAGDVDPCTDDGLRQTLDVILRADSWDLPVAHALVAEIRRRAGRNAKRVASTTGVALDRGLVDDVLLAAWLILRRHGEKVLAAVRPWAYLMSSAQRQVLDEVRAQQLLTNTASIRGRAREALPQVVRPVGSTATDLAAALRHEPRGAGVDSAADPRILRQVGRHEPLPLLADHSEQEGPAAVGEREPWFAAFINLLVEHGADQAVTVAAVDRLADLLAVTYVGWWEWAARRDPVLAELGLCADQCSALVALLAGSRRYRHNGKRDSLLAAVRTATRLGRAVHLSTDQRRRLAVFAGTVQHPRRPVATARALAAAGV